MGRSWAGRARWEVYVGLLTAAACLVSLGLVASDAHSGPPLWLATILVSAAVASACTMGLLVAWRSARSARSAKDRAQELELALGARADIDEMTGLRNRKALERVVHQRLAQRQNGVNGCALLIFDLDDFGELNLRYGRAVADAVLAETSNRLRRCLRRSDVLARNGSDEFAILLDDVGDPDQAFDAADRIAGLIESPVTVGPMAISLTASVGVALSDECGMDGNKLFLAATLALSSAKEDPAHRIQVCADPLTTRSFEKLDLMAELDQAMSHPDRLELHFQPIASSRDGDMVGIEALLRWQHPKLGLLLPEQFLGGAEMSGLSIRLGEVVIAKVIAQLREWDEAGIDVPTLTVNISGNQLRSGAVTSSIRAATRQGRFDPGRVRVEITDGFAARHNNDVAQRIHELRSAGVSTALDGLASVSLPLGMLRDLPVDRVKLDISAGARTGDPSSALPRPFDLIKVVIDTLGIPVSAKGVEETRHLELARTLGCEEVQGSYIGAPVSPAAASSLIRLGTTRLSR